MNVALNNDSSLLDADDLWKILSGDGDVETQTGTAGNDRLFGGRGMDKIDGGAGDDFLLGGSENDYLIGGAGQDLLLGDSGNDLLDGGEGNDLLFGGADNDILRGGAGDDLLFGQSGEDALAGGAGMDLLFGGEGNDTLDGNDGNDLLFGEEGNDILEGGAGNDFLEGGEGDDTLYGFSWGGEQAPAQDANAKVNLDEPLSDTDILFGGLGADTFEIRGLIDAKDEIVAKHTDENGDIDYLMNGIAGENGNTHDHWVETIDVKIIADFNATEDEVGVVVVLKNLLETVTVDAGVFYGVEEPFSVLG